jgi:hypothetical protein
LIPTTTQQQPCAGVKFRRLKRPACQFVLQIFVIRNLRQGTGSRPTTCRLKRVENLVRSESENLDSCPMWNPSSRLVSWHVLPTWRTNVQTCSTRGFESKQTNQRFWLLASAEAFVWSTARSSQCPKHMALSPLKILRQFTDKKHISLRIQVRYGYSLGRYSCVCDSQNLCYSYTKANPFATDYRDHK